MLNRYSLYPEIMGAGVGCSISIIMITGYLGTMELLKWLL